MKREFYLMQVRNINILILLIIFLFFSSCSGKRSSIDFLAKIYVESLIIDETYLNDKNLADKKKKELFSKYKISMKDYKNKLLELSNNKEEWEDFFKRINELLIDLKKSGAIK